MKDIKDYLPYYIGQKCITISYDGIKRERVISFPLFGEMSLTGKFGYHIATVQPILRRLSDMTGEEMIGLLQSMVPEDMEDKPTDDDYSLEMFRNDGGNLVDRNVLVGAEYTCRCFIGQITIKNCGTICAYDESGDEQELVNAPKAYHYLLKQGFDLFGLIDAGLAIDVKTLNQQV